MNPPDPANPDRIRFVLVALPMGVLASQLDYAERLGARAAVAARIADLLPGVTFDAQGRGVFSRAGYEITFTLVGDEPKAVVVETDRVDALAAVKRLADKTGWRAVDTRAGCFMDLEASRAAGTAVHEPATLVNGQSEATSIWRSKFVWQSALLIPLLAGTWVSWEWSRRVQGAPRPPKLTAPAEGLSVLSAGRRASTSVGEHPDSSVTAQATLQQMGISAARVRSRILYSKLLAPEFRDNPIAQQMIDYSLAADLFPSVLGDTGFLPPERLSDPRMFEGLGIAPYLPASFANPQRDGYAFFFDGHDCNRLVRGLRQVGNSCSGFVYSARPLTQKTGAPSFALFSADDRIHYRTDGMLPTQTDPTVDNTAPSSAADLGAAGVPPADKSNSAVSRALRTAMGTMARSAGFRNAAAATAAVHEQNAIADLRQVLAAENTFQAMMGLGYASPERLADAASAAAAQVQPLLRGYFVQPQRQGYRFTFTGEQPMPSAPYPSFGPLYQSFVYSAVPTEPGPAGRRAFAIYPNGLIYVTSERRAPTLRDVPLSQSQ